jgi:ubiquinone/menaquinone biosynthesis C-methylase UbiE
MGVSLRETPFVSGCERCLHGGEPPCRASRGVVQARIGYPLPHLYDAIYSFKDYAADASRLTDLIRERNPTARTLLDVACGTGKHLESLRNEFEIEGLDLDEGLLAVARERLGAAVPLHQGDMRDFDLGRRFDAVTCLFSAIGHVADTEELDAAIGTMARHLGPGGVLIVEPWLEPDVWIPGRLHLLTVDEPELKIARITVPEKHGITSVMNFHYLVATPDGVETFAARLEHGLFTRDEYRTAFERAGLTVEHDEEGLTGRGLWIGTASAA